MLHHGAPAAHLQTEDFCGGGFLIGVNSKIQWNTRVGWNKKSIGKVYKQFSISIKSSWPCAFSYSTIMPVRTLRVCWNRSSTASLEGEFSDEGQSNWNRSEKNMGEGVKHINQKLLTMRIQLLHCYTSQDIGGVLELVVNCFPWRWVILWGTQ